MVGKFIKYIFVKPHVVHDKFLWRFQLVLFIDSFY